MNIIIFITNFIKVKIIHVIHSYYKDGYCELHYNIIVKRKYKENENGYIKNLLIIVMNFRMKMLNYIIVKDGTYRFDDNNHQIINYIFIRSIFQAIIQ